MGFVCVGAVTKQTQWLRPPPPCFQTRLHVWTGHPLKKTPPKSEACAAARQEGSAEICTEPKCCQRMMGMW